MSFCLMSRKLQKQNQSSNLYDVCKEIMTFFLYYFPNYFSKFFSKQTFIIKVFSFFPINSTTQNPQYIILQYQSIYLFQEYHDICYSSIHPPTYHITQPSHPQQISYMYHQILLLSLFLLLCTSRYLIDDPELSVSVKKFIILKPIVYFQGRDNKSKRRQNDYQVEEPERAETGSSKGGEEAPEAYRQQQQEQRTAQEPTYPSQYLLTRKPAPAFREPQNTSTIATPTPKKQTLKPSSKPRSSREDDDTDSSSSDQNNQDEKAHPTKSPKDEMKEKHPWLSKLLEFVGNDPKINDIRKTTGAIE